MKQEKISRIKKLQFETWRSKLGRLLNNSHNSLKSPQTLFQVTLSQSKGRMQGCKAIRVIEVEETLEIQVEVPTEKSEIIAEIKNQEDVKYPPQSSKKHT
ncbi:hypothetical protein PIB30_112665, partial [Stylosanthes scabra]|nr:hypothetical protein [Stylosanthes scabra]